MGRLGWLVPAFLLTTSVACGRPGAAAPAAAAPAPAAEHHRHSSPTAQHRFRDPERWSKEFDDPARDRWQRPDDVVGFLALRPDAVVADLGAGTGYFTVRLARAVPQGRVLAVDIERSMVDYTLERAKRLGLSNVEGIVATEDDAELPNGVSLVLVVDTYHHLSQRSAYFRRVREHLGPDGRVVIVDFKPGDLPVGPPARHKIPPERATEELAEAGFTACGSFDQLPYQYVIAFCPE
jgi:SAM-dependent methyltransferase